jgi:hypothetical protein
LRFLLLAFVRCSAMKTLWGTCMVKDVVAAWLPTPPCFAFDILPLHGDGIGILPWLFISLMRSPSFI